MFVDQVHLAMVRYHEAGRFCEKDEEWDQTSALYHLETAAVCGELEAIVALGQCYLQLPHHILPEIELQVWRTCDGLFFCFMTHVVLISSWQSVDVHQRYLMHSALFHVFMCKIRTNDLDGQESISNSCCFVTGIWGQQEERFPLPAAGRWGRWQTQYDSSGTSVRHGSKPSFW